MNDNGQNNGLAMVFAFFTGFMAGAGYQPALCPEFRQGNPTKDS